MSNSLYSFWKELSLDSKPYIHPRDKEIVKQYLKQLDCNWKEFVSNADLISEKENTMLYTSLIPVPYVGDLEKAEVIILMTNPAFNPMSIWAEENSKEFFDALKSNLYRDKKSKYNPFLFLDPNFSWHPGFVYWTRRLKRTIDRIMEKRNLSHLQALEWVGQKIACVQLFAYSSKTLDSIKINSLFPQSVKAVQDYINKKILPQAKQNKKLVIVVRSIEAWGIPKGKNVILCNNSINRNAYFESDENLRSRLWSQIGCK